MSETFGLNDREGWAPGPWDGEPDLVTWRGDGLACGAARSPEMGCWCGYVEIPREHPWFGVFVEDLPHVIDVHGGVTFAGVRGEGWWIGFDCGHYDDVMPGLDALLVMIGARAPGDPDPLLFGTYKTLDFVLVECGRLAMQVYLAGMM